MERPALLRAKRQQTNGRTLRAFRVLSRSKLAGRLLAPRDPDRPARRSLMRRRTREPKSVISLGAHFCSKPRLLGHPGFVLLEMRSSI